MIKLFLVDDHKLILEAWKLIFESTDDITVVKTATNVQEAKEYALVYRPDIILMDINLGQESGLDLCIEIINTLPKIKVIGLSFHDNIQMVKKFIDCGASGYLTKNVTPNELLEAIRTVSNGGNYICEEIQRKLIQQNLFQSESKAVELTMRELEIVKHLAKGMSSKEIATTLSLASRTVETHRYNILKKTGCMNVAQVISWASKNGIV